MNDKIFGAVDAKSLNLQGGKLEGAGGVCGSITAAKELSIYEDGVWSIDVADNAAADITLPPITADMIGITYEFFLGTANTDALRIVTNDTTDTTGDIFTGSLLNITNAANGPTTGTVMAVVPGANDSAIVLDENLANCAAQVGSYIKCTAHSFSSTVYSKWIVSGYIINDTAAGTGAGVFADID